ncbi:hypothetical protein [Dokdonella sp.]|uniref:hypothetical protein n=1 Tax=Dokdonella sp. TaxID=2291710 RepID=UPI003783EAD9
MRTGSRWKIVPVLMSAAITVHAADAPPSVDDADAMMSRYKQAQIALFDALRSDPSPARQVLAGRLYVDDDDTPSALRPKSADVVARAAGLAPDDAFVQWLAADVGSYYSSKCGPTRWPEAEVANLVRLEPDNAGALQYAAALAHARGDQAGVDDALARMASARRADDHLGDEIAAWALAYIAHPVASPFDETSGESGKSDASPQSNALASALQRTDFRSSPAESALEESCKPAADSDRTWQRLGWCADAGVLLATRGNSFNLRELGLKMLAAAGATRDDVADLQRQLDWLKANAASPMQNGAAFTDAPADRAADWNGAPSEIAATERRLKRLGKPLAPPAGWMPANDESVEDPDQKAARQTWQDYVESVINDLRGSSDARERATGLAAARRTSELSAGGAAKTPGGGDAPANVDAPAKLADLAAANPGDLLLQWIAATPTDGKRDATALANVQRLDKDNAAAWALSLDDPAVDVGETLQHMAASHRYDEHSSEIIRIWLAAVKRHPVPAETLDGVRAQSPQWNFSGEDIVASTAVMLAAMTSVEASPYTGLLSACATADAQRKPMCIATARLLFDSGYSTTTVMIGEMLLRKLDALGPDDQLRARRLAWWTESQMSIFMTGDALSQYLRDTLSTGSEIEALRLAATRAGKAEPPADWKSPSEKAAAKAEARKAAAAAH